MTTSYYIMQMAKNRRNVNFGEYFSDVQTSPLRKTKDDLTTAKCRVCLKQGRIPICDTKNATDVTEALSKFGDIEINVHDDLPQHLCEICYTFIKGAIMFRKTAKQTNEILKRFIKEENLDLSQNSPNNYTDDFVTNEIEEKSHQNWPNDDFDDFNNIKVEKKEKQKLSAKITCHVCNKVINRSYYKQHITMHDPNHSKYVCDVCGKSFRLRCAYHNHSLRHSNDFAYKCQFCPYRGRYAELLKTHMRTHTGDYRYMCTECPARFLFKSNLNSHMLKHKEPQFKCDSCKRAFHTKLTLQRHFEADHLGIKNHVCNICGKAFGYRNAMMKHQRHVHKREKSLHGRMPSYLEAERKHRDINF